MTDKEWKKLLDTICAGVECSDHKCPFYDGQTCLISYFSETDEDEWGNVLEPHRGKLIERVRNADIIFLERKALLDTTYGDKDCVVLEPYIRSTELL